MPPKTKVTKEMILKATMKITREKGFDNVNARSLADEIGCSTQPIFSQYSSMTGLKKEFYLYLANYYNEYVLSKSKGGMNFNNIGLAYIEFAGNEKNYFKLLFMSEYFGLNGFSDMFTEGNLMVANMVAKNLEISLEDAKSLFMKIWVFTHGIASLIATDSIKLSEHEAENLMNDAYQAFLLQVRTKNSGKD